MKTVRYTLCDVFTSQPLTGNALAVFTSPYLLKDEQYQAIAREMNLSETTFVLPPESTGQARIRIFTPNHELPFAGHPILGSAVVIGRTISVDVLHLETGKGIVPVALNREGAHVRGGFMSQPLPTFEAWTQSEALLSALGIENKPSLPIEVYDNGPRHVVVAVEDIELGSLRPNLAEVERLHHGPVAVITRGKEGFEARVFVPAFGIPEDPATGSAAGAIAVHAIRHGWAVAGQDINITQGVHIGRPSKLVARVTGDRKKIEMVEVGGDVVVIGRGELSLPF